MNAQDFLDDIPLDLAIAAHSGTSHTPERRGEQERGGYASTLAQDYAELAKLAPTPEKAALLATEFARYRAGYRSAFVAYLSARSRCMSTMITGGSNFPVRSQRKKNDAADKRTDELLGFRVRALAAIRKVLTPELQPIRQSDANAAERYEDKIAKAEALQDLMRASNAAIRANKKSGPDAQVAALVALGHAEGVARELLTPDMLGRIGFADYQLTNNAANIRRMKARITVVEAAQATPESVVEGERARLEDAPADNRVRLFFPGKPDAAIRARLKAAAFRWTPSLGCWQAFRNRRALEVARREAGIEVAS